MYDKDTKLNLINSSVGLFNETGKMHQSLFPS